MVPPDAVDRILEQWGLERPDLDASPMGVLGRISRAAQLVEHRVAPVFEAFGLSSADFDVLATLRRAGEPFRLNPTALSASSMVSSGGMTKRLDRLERAALVRRMADPADRRGVIVELTPAGRQLVDQAVEAHIANEERLLAALPAAQRATLVDILRVLLTALEQGESSVAPTRRRDRRTSRIASGS